MEHRPEILVGVDGSAAAYGAVRWAAEEAALRGCGLLIVHATDPHAYGLWTSPPIVREGLRELALPYVQSAEKQAVRAAPSIDVRTRVMVASTAKVLVRLSRDAELTVIGQSGRSGLSRAVLGSIAERVLANAQGPVIAVPSDGPGAAHASIGRIVVVVDDPVQHQRTLRFAFEEAQRRRVPLHVVHVPDGGSTTEGGEPGLWLASWREQFRGVSVTYEEPCGSLSAAIHDSVKPADLLVIGHHRPVFLPSALGRHGRTLFRRADCPIAVVGEPDIDVIHAPDPSGDAAIPYDF